MASKHVTLMALALPPLAASLLVLAAGGVSKSVWLMHLLSIGLATALALSAPLWRRLVHQQGHHKLTVAIMAVTLLSLALPLLIQSSGPDRWLLIGPLRLYMAPLWLPSVLAVCAVHSRERTKRRTGLWVSILAIGLALALQPDASQALALLAGSAVLFTRLRPVTWRTGATLLGMALLTAWAFFQPDPLQPVPHVEGVFALALSQSLLTGLSVIAAAIAWVMGMCRLAAKRSFWLAPVAAYYSVLLACSIAGLTPAPLIGFGAGPILGFALLVATTNGLNPELEK